MDILANGAFSYSKRPRNLRWSLTFFLLMEKLRDMKAIWMGNREDRLDWNPCGPLSLFIDPGSLSLPMLFPFVFFHAILRCHLPVLRSLKVTFVFFVSASFASTWCLWVTGKAAALPGSLVTFLHWLLLVSAFERKREKKSDLLNGSSPSLRPSGSLIIKAWCSNLLRSVYPLERVERPTLSTRTSL